MNINFLPGQPNGICEGCLSHDRTLTQVNKEFNAVYCCYIRETVAGGSFPLLCWECVANIHKFITFKRKCLKASSLLNKYLVSPKALPTLSTISVYKTNTHSIPNSDQNLSEQKSSQNFKSANEIVCRKINNYSNIKQDSMTADKIAESTEGSAVKDDEKAVLEVQNVKLEHLEDVEACFLEDGFSYQDDDLKDSTTVHNLDSESKRKIKRKRVKKKKSDEEFDCSDEEPLHIKRSKSLTELEQKKSKDDVHKAPTRGLSSSGVVRSAAVVKKLRQLNVPEGVLEMVVLTWEQVEEERERARYSESYTRHKYRCELCVVGFNHRHKLSHHMGRHDVSSGALFCVVCNVRFRDKHALSAHHRRHRLRWRCCLCSGSWSRASVAADHAAREHATIAPQHKCTLCGHVAHSLGKLRSHLKNSHSERQKCELCGKTFRDRTSLRTHLFIHRGEKEYSCPKCEKKFLFKKAMEVHLVTHDQSAHLYCHQCDVTFKNRMSFSQHMKYSLKHIHPDRLRFACSQCDKKFAKEARLKEHQLAVHLKLTPIHCPEPGCSFACSSRPVLRTHTRTVHREMRAQRNHVCHSCGKTYTTKKALEGHMRTHTGERPFKCASCPSTFGYEAALYNHNKLVHRKMNKKSAQNSLPVQDTGPPVET